MRLAVLASLTLASIARAQSPWLPEEQQSSLRSLIPDGVPFSSTTRFFRLPQKFQELIVLNSAPTNTIRQVTTQEHPWIVSGGMHWADRGKWRNATALDIPKGKLISWWVENVDAGAPQPVPRVRWSFPIGTLAYDVLLAKPKWKEYVFEVRIHEKTEFGWDHGTTYRPLVDVQHLTLRNHAFRFTFGAQRDGFAINESIDGNLRWFEVDHIEPGVSFAPTSKVIKDWSGFVPDKYYGAGFRCQTCHDMVGRRTGYGTVIRGDDGRFSWHPFDSNNQIDGRWPLARRMGR